jgi:hypothetical protein
MIEAVGGVILALALLALMRLMGFLSFCTIVAGGLVLAIGMKVGLGLGLTHGADEFADGVLLVLVVLLTVSLGFIAFELIRRRMAARKKPEI